MALDRKLLELLICPVTRGPLEYDQEHGVLISQSAKLVYPIREGIPVLNETQAMDLQEWIDQGKPVLEPVAIAEPQMTDEPDMAQAQQESAQSDEEASPPHNNS